MKSLLALLLTVLSCHLMAAPTDPAPLPEDVLSKLLHEPFQQPVDPVVRQLQQRLDETGDLLRRWQRDTRAEAEPVRLQQLAAQIEALAQMQAPVQARLGERTSRALEQVRGKRAQAKALRAQTQATKTLLGHFDRLHAALEKIQEAATPAARAQAIARALDGLSPMLDRGVAPSAVPWPTDSLGGAAGPSPRKRVDATPKYLSEQQTYYRNSVAANGSIVLAAAPATPAEAGQCYAGGSVEAADLAATPDAQKDDPEIVALAETLGHSPAKMLAWVHDNIRYEPYWGSLKGAKGALVAGSGNATDQASLLIALLRAANIPARYVTGIIRINDSEPAQPGGRALRWLGAKTYQAAVWMLDLGGIPAATVNNTAGQVSGISLEHVWVEACVPYGHYRGAAVSNAGHRWVPLDAAFKDRASRQDVDVDVSFDYGFDAGDYLAARSDELPHEHYTRQVEAALPAGKDLTDLAPVGSVNPLKLDILPASLPYEVTGFMLLTGATSVEPAELPDAHRYSFEVTVKNGSTSLLSRSVSYPDAALKRLTLSFTPADSVSQTWWNSWNGSYATLPTGSGVNVLPVLKLEGEEVTGTAATAVSLTSSKLITTLLKLRLADSNWGAVCIADSGSGNDPDTTCVNKAVYDNIKPGGFYALHAHAFQTSDRYLNARAQQLIDAVRANPAPTPASPAAYDATLGEFLHLALTKYLRYNADSARQIGEQTNTSGLRGNDIGLTTVDLKTEYLFDQPYAIKASGLVVDVKGGQTRYVKLDTVTSDAATLKDEIWPAFKLSLYSDSAYEHYIWQETARTDAVSTVRGLQFARENGDSDSIVILDSANFGQYDTLMDASMAPYKTSIKSYVDAGATVTVPRKTLAFIAEGSGEFWNGVVWMAENPGKGSFGAIISGSFGGGYGALTATSLLTDFNVNYSFIDSAIPSTLLGTTTTYFSLYNSTTLSDGFNTYQSTGGDPVNLITGNFYHVERDLSIPGRGDLPLVFERSYNSRQPKDGALGFGWTHSFNHRLKFYGVEDGQAKVGWVDGTGGEKFFGTASNILGKIATNTTLTNPAGIHVVFQRESTGQYTITEKNGLKYTFESVDGSETDTGLKARLLSIADRNNNALLLAYDDTLQYVIDGIGRKLTFTYTGGRITKLEFRQADGSVVRTHEYTYDTAGNLASHKSPATLVDPAKAPPVTYQYYSAADGPNLDHAMKQYQLPRGNGMAFHYYADGRVFRHAAFGPGGADLGQEYTFRYNSFRRETVQTNERGLARTFIFDENGNPASITEENGAFRNYAYDPAHPFNRTAKTDPYGLTTQYQYDGNGNVTGITNPDGNTVEFFDFTAFNQPRRIKDARGNWTLLTYDAKGNLTDDLRLRSGVTPTADVTPAAADVLAWRKYRYDSVGNRTGFKALKDFAAVLGDFDSGPGPVVATSFDGNNLYPVAVSRSGDKTGDGVDDPADSETLGYDAQGREIRGIDADWHVVERQYDAVDRVIRATDSLGYWRDHAYDANGNPVEATLTVDDVRVDSAVSVYDGADRRVQSLDAAGNVTAWQRDARGNPLRITDPDGYSLAFDYDALDRWVVATDAAGNSVTRSLDISGRVRAVTDPNGNTTRRTWWDATQNGRMKESFDALDRRTAYDWDANGNLVRLTDNLGKDRRLHYDALNRPVREVGPANGQKRPVTCYQYTPLGHVAALWAGSTSDPDTPVCDTSGADPAITLQASLGWNDFGWQVSETDPLNNTWTRSHDRHGNVLVHADALGQQIVHTWEHGHQLKTRTAINADGSLYNLETTTRSPLGQPLRIEQSTPALTQTYSYDPAHRLVAETDSRGNKQLSYSWSPGGLLNTVEDSDGHRTDHLYDGVGRLIGLWAPNYDYMSFAHDPGGRLIETRHSRGGGTRITYNPDDSLATLENRSAGDALVSRHAYQYDSLGRRYRHNEDIGSLGVKYWQYSFDNLARLTETQLCASASYSTCLVDETFVYDLLGNRTRHLRGVVERVHLVDAAHQTGEIREGSSLKAVYLWNRNGELVKRCGGSTVEHSGDACTGSQSVDYEHDPLGRLIRAGSERYAYDPQGRRISKTVAGLVTQYRYRGLDLHGEYADDGSVGAIYVQGPRTDSPLMRLTGTTTGPAAETGDYHQDGLGSVVGQTGQSGATLGLARFDAWGNKTQSTGTINQYGYTGREPDATGLIYYRARYYDPTIGRFISRDPAGRVDGVNRYAYVANNPVNLVDPMGLYAKEYDLNSATADISYALDATSLGGIASPADYSLANNNQPTYEEDPFAGSFGQGSNVAINIGPGCSADGIWMMCGGGAGGGLVGGGGRGGSSGAGSLGGGVAKTYQTYTRTNPTTGEVYSGRTFPSNKNKGQTAESKGTQ